MKKFQRPKRRFLGPSALPDCLIISVECPLFLKTKLSQDFCPFLRQKLGVRFMNSNRVLKSRAKVPLSVPYNLISYDSNKLVKIIFFYINKFQFLRGVEYSMYVSAAEFFCSTFDVGWEMCRMAEGMVGGH